MMSMLVALSLAIFQTAPEKFDPQPDEDKRLVCRTRPMTGSRVGSKICHTQAQWDAISEQHMRDTKEMVDRPAFEARRE